MVRSAAWLEHVCGVEVLNIGRPAGAKEDCIMELCGRSLFYWISIRGTWIWVSVCPLDEATERPESLFNLGDGPPGWTTVRRFIAALERSGITSLQPRPLHIGSGSGPDSFVIA